MILRIRMHFGLGEVAFIAEIEVRLGGEKLGGEGGEVGFERSDFRTGGPEAESPVGLDGMDHQKIGDIGALGEGRGKAGKAVLKMRPVVAPRLLAEKASRIIAFGNPLH